MDNLAHTANTAIAWQRFGYAGVVAFVLTGASFSTTERRLFDSGVIPTAFSAVPVPSAGGPGGLGAAFPLIRSFAFHTAPEPPSAADVAPYNLPGGATPSAPVEIASANPSVVPDALIPSSLTSSPLQPPDANAPVVATSGPGSGVLTPANVSQPTTTLPGTGTGGVTNPGTGTTTNPGTGTGTTTNPGTGTTTNPGTGTTTNPGTGTGTTTNPGTGTTPGNPPQTGPGTVSPVPEPATWAMMLMGFFAIGLARRSQRRGLKQANA